MRFYFDQQYCAFFFRSAKQRTVSQQFLHCLPADDGGLFMPTIEKHTPMNVLDIFFCLFLFAIDFSSRIQMTFAVFTSLLPSFICSHCITKLELPAPNGCHLISDTRSHLMEFSSYIKIDICFKIQHAVFFDCYF